MKAYLFLGAVIFLNLFQLSCASAQEATLDNQNVSGTMEVSIQESPRPALGNDNSQLFAAAEDAMNIYFRRYNPITRIIDNRMIGVAAYGAYPVLVIVTPTTGGYSLEVESPAGEARINQWKANIRARINDILH